MSARIYPDSQRRVDQKHCHLNPDGAIPESGQSKREQRPGSCRLHGFCFLSAYFGTRNVAERKAGMIRAVFLDVDNTLLSFDEAVRGAMREGFARFGLPPFEETMFSVFHQVNHSLWTALERGEIDLAYLRFVRWKRVFERLGVSGDERQFESFFRAWLFESAVPEDGAMDLIHSLYGRYMLCVASNGPDAQQRSRLGHAGMLPYFSHLFISEKVGASKPDRAFFLACFRSLETIDPAESVMIGDSITSDIIGGAESGMKTVWYNPKGLAVPPEVQPDAVVTSLREIPGWLDGCSENRDVI